MELDVIETDDGILLRPKAPFEKTTLDKVAGCLEFKGKAKTPDDIELTMKAAAKEAWRDSN